LLFLLDASRAASVRTAVTGQKGRGISDTEKATEQAAGSVAPLKASPASVAVRVVSVAQIILVASVEKATPSPVVYFDIEELVYLAELESVLDPSADKDPDRKPAKVETT